MIIYWSISQKNYRPFLMPKRGIIVRIIIFVLFFIIILLENIIAYEEQSAFNMKSPTGIEPGQSELKIQHRFYGKINEEPLKTLFGMYTGANVGLGIRYVVLSGLEIDADYTNYNKESTFGASYTYLFPLIMLRSQVGFSYYGYETYNLDVNQDERVNNIFTFLSLQSEPMLKRFLPILNISYDLGEQYLGLGFGANFIILERVGTLRKMILIGEYFPSKKDNGNKNCYSFGLRLETYGHHFDFLLGNSSEIGIRRLMLGTTRQEGLYFGFNIKRLID